MQFKLTHKDVRILNITRSVPKFDISFAFYRFHLTVSEAFLLKIPPQMEVESLTIVGSEKIFQLDPDTMQLLSE